MSDITSFEVVSESPWARDDESSRAFLEVRLRLLMKEREDELGRLVELDCSIWELEERLRRVR